MAEPPMAQMPPETTEDTEALLQESVSSRDVELGRGALPRTRIERAYEAMTRTRVLAGLAMVAAVIVLAPSSPGTGLLGLWPTGLVGLEETGCLADEELFQGICYMRCSVLTAGEAPYRVGATSCCQTDNLFCMLFKGMSTNSPALQIGGGQSPPNTPPHAPNIGGICDDMGHGGTEETLNGLCYKKCSHLTDGKSPVRVAPTVCCGGGFEECQAGKGKMDFNDAYGKYVHAPADPTSILQRGASLNVAHATCADTEEEKLGICYAKCSTLTYGKAAHRVSPDGCCNCQNGPFQGLCCMLPWNVQASPTFNVGADVKGKAREPHSPGFAVRCSYNEEDFSGLCYAKCSILTNGKMPHRMDQSTCCKFHDVSSCIKAGNFISSPIFLRGGDKAAGVPHGPYTRPDEGLTLIRK